MTARSVTIELSEQAEDALARLRTMYEMAWRKMGSTPPEVTDSVLISACIVSMADLHQSIRPIDQLPT
ncbi:MAG: hypothetical protein OXF79_28880 [Chloroflexi bacterium]|nr:hypothetical protein [Chloroflexota bacterium]